MTPQKRTFVIGDGERATATIDHDLDGQVQVSVYEAASGRTVEVLLDFKPHTVEITHGYFTHEGLQSFPIPRDGFVVVLQA